LVLCLVVALPLVACLKNRGDTGVRVTSANHHGAIGLAETPGPDEVNPDPGAIDTPPTTVAHTEILRATPPAREPTLLPDVPAAISQQGAGSATISWIPPSQNEDGTPLLDLAGFNIYIGAEVGVYTQSINIDNPGITRLVIDELDPGTHYFVATAFSNTREESAYSNMIVRRVE
jgi:hypothetical protein